MLTVTLIIGVLVGLLLAEITGITAGAIIAPGYIALLLDQPKALLGVHCSRDRDACHRVDPGAVACRSTARAA